MMYKELKNSYTWKDEYCLPFETEWARIAKFCFLNGVSWSYVKKNIILRNHICVENERYIHYDLPQFMSANKTSEEFKICPQCMKYGYQSYLHEIKGMDYCFLHKCTLINILPDEVRASEDGTYKFIDISVENIVRNKELQVMIQNFVFKRKNEGILDAKYFFPRHGKMGTKVCYESTERIFQKFYLLQEDVDIYGCKCIQYISKDDIDAENERLAQEILKNYAKYDVTYGFSLFTKNFEETFLYMQESFMEKDSRVLHQLKEDILGWCVMKIMWDIIEKLFDGYDDWNNTVWSLNGYPRNSMTKDKIDKYAVILAFQAITSATAAKNAICNQSGYWYRNACICRFGLNVGEELRNYREPFQLYGHFKEQKASQYTVFPIIEDLFNDLTRQAYEMLKNEFIELDSEQINNLDSNIWNIPQYVVLYYLDRTEIYRCEPDY